MFHAEGYVDRHTYFHKGHIFWLGLQYQTYMCSAWCVFKALPLTKRPDFERAFSDWFYRQLVLALEKGGLEIQKEVNRFGGFLANMQQVYQIEEMPFICLYFRGRLYTFAQASDDIYAVGEQRGLYLGNVPKGTVQKSLQDIYEKQKKNTLEEAANALKTGLLLAVDQGKIGQGYFLLWEDKCGI